MSGAKKYLLETLVSGKSVMNAIIKYDSYPARRIDVFFSPPDLYPFALLAKTGDIPFNKSIRTCLKEKNEDFLLSDKGIRKVVNGKYETVVDPAKFPDEKSIFSFIGIQKREPGEMVGTINCTDTVVKNLKTSRIS
jgi:DNA polymerase/3'-5' exonuclease PolX